MSEAQSPELFENTEKYCQTLLTFAEQTRRLDLPPIAKKEIMDVFEYTAKNPLQINSSSEAKWYGAPLSIDYTGCNNWFIVAVTELAEDQELRAGVLDINKYGDNFGEFENLCIEEEGIGNKLFVSLRGVSKTHKMASITSILNNFYTHNSLRRKKSRNLKIQDVPTGEYL